MPCKISSSNDHRISFDIVCSSCPAWRCSMSVRSCCVDFYIDDSSDRLCLWICANPTDETCLEHWGPRHPRCLNPSARLTLHRYRPCLACFFFVSFVVLVCLLDQNHLAK